MSIRSFYDCKFIWTIENISHCYQVNDFSIRSPVFTIDCSSGSQWRLLLVPRNKPEEECMDLYLESCTDEMNEKNFMDGMVEFIDPDNRVICRREWNILTSNWQDMSIYHKYVTLAIAQNKILEWSINILTIRCYFKRKTPPIYNAISKILTDVYSFKWEMAKPKTSDWRERKEITIQKSLQFQINITAPEKDILITIKKLNGKGSSPFFVRCKIILTDANGGEIKSETAEHIFKLSSSNNIWKFPSFINKDLLKIYKSHTNSYFKYDAHFKYGAFTLVWEFSYSKYEESYKDYVVSELKDDFADMLKSEKHSDIKLRSGNVIIPAHKSVLSARSPHFSKMFDQNRIQNNSGIVDIVDCDEGLLNIFLKYLYSDVLDISDSEIALKLLLVAEVYQVPTLKERCCCFLMSNLTDQNVREVLVAADKIGMTRLKFSAMNYIKTNAKNILNSSEGREWVKNNSSLATEIICLNQ